MPDKQPKMEGEVYYPSKEVIAQANIKDWDKLAEFARKDLQGFWAKEAEELEWYQKWDKVLDDSISGLKAQGMPVFTVAW